MAIVRQYHPRRNTVNNRRRAYAVFVAIALAGSCLTSPLAAQESPKAQAISVIVARTGEVVRTVRLIGEVVAREAISLRADLNGLRIISVEAEAGDFVQAGDVLVRLDDAILRAEERELAARLMRAEGAISQARNELEDSEIALVQANADMRRSGALQKQGFASSQATEVLGTALKRAGTARKIAAQALRLATIDRQVIEAESANLAARLEKTLVRAPVAGRIQDRLATVGMMVAGEGAPLFTLAEDAVLEVEAELTEQDFALVGVGQDVELWVSGGEDPVRGTVRLVLPQLASGTRLGRIRVTLPPGLTFSVGAFVRGKVEVSRSEGVVVPASAVTINGAVSSLWRESEGIVKRIRVETGVRTGSIVHVVSGLKEGARVVLKAGSLLTEGDRIAPVEVAFEPPSRALPILQSARADR